MKRTILKAFIFLAACSATAALAANVTINATTSIGSLGFTPSNHVFVKVTANGTGYVTEALHQKGSRVFLTDSVETKFYFHDATIDASSDTNTVSSFDSLTAPTTTGTHGSPDPTSGSGWTSM